MKKLLYILAGLGLAACTSDIEELPEVGPQPGREVTLTGISGTASRTQFVPGDGTEIQFQWSTGDRIWAGGVQSAEAGTDGNVADFGFTNLPGAAPYRIYYNMTGTDAEAVVPTEQRQAEPGKLQLGPNGDFGYATTDSEGRFTLSHATAYVWFNPWSQDVKEKLVSVTLAATDASTVLTGTRTFDGTGFSDATDANNAVTLSFGKEGVELPATSSTASVFAAAVVYPADCSAEEIHVTYTFADGSVYTETKTGRNFEAGRIYRLTTEIAKRDGGSLEIQGLEDSDETRLYEIRRFGSVCTDGRRMDSHGRNDIGTGRLDGRFRHRTAFAPDRSSCGIHRRNGFGKHRNDPVRRQADPLTGVLRARLHPSRRHVRPHRGQHDLGERHDRLFRPTHALS
ncbi:MAG: hypothetical protein ACLURY_07210 [Alistipes putredinis]